MLNHINDISSRFSTKIFFFFKDSDRSAQSKGGAKRKGKNPLSRWRTSIQIQIEKKYGCYVNVL